MTRLLTVLLLSLLAGPAAGQQPKAPGPGFLVCYPNAPGSTRAAQPVMTRLGDYLGERLSRPCQPVYFNVEADAKRWLETHRPRFGILSLSLYLRWKDRLRLRAVSLSERVGRTREQYRLLVRKGTHTSLASLTRKGLPHIWSAHLEDPRFATNVVFDGKLTVREVRKGERTIKGFSAGPRAVRVVSTTRPISALRRMKKGRAFKKTPVDAVLVDGTSWSTLKKLKMFRGVLHVLYTSPPLPTPPVVAFPGASAGQRRKLNEVLGGMQRDAEGIRLLKTLMTTGFVTADAKVLAAAASTYGREPGARPRADTPGPRPGGTTVKKAP